jgi:RNA polymerase-interacting CarD/CdnL/TRCF family regulator
VRFNVNDIVIHPSYGFGRITGIETLQYPGNEVHPYFIVTMDNGTMWVPADSPDTIHIRPVTPKQDLDNYRELLKSQPLPLSDDRYKRSAECTSRLKIISFSSLCEVVRDLSAFGRTKKLNDYDSATLRKITENLVKEWAFSAEMTILDAEKEIKGLLLTTK